MKRNTFVWLFPILIMGPAIFTAEVARGQSSTNFNLLRTGFANGGGSLQSSSYMLKESALGVPTSGSASSTNFRLDGILVITEVKNPAEWVGLPLPIEFFLQQNYPNPFNPGTTIEYVLPQTAEVRITIYNALGQEVRSLTPGKQAAGTHHVQWDGKDSHGMAQPSGVYIYRIVAGKFVDARKMILLQ